MKILSVGTPSPRATERIRAIRRALEPGERRLRLDHTPRGADPARPFRANSDDAVPSTTSSRTVVLISGMVGLMVSICLAFFIEYTVRIHQAGRTAPILNELGKDVERVRRLLGRKG